MREFCVNDSAMIQLQIWTYTTIQFPELRACCSADMGSTNFYNMLSSRGERNVPGLVQKVSKVILPCKDVNIKGPALEETHEADPIRGGILHSL